MKIQKIEIYKSGIKDIIIELVNTKKTTEVWITRKNYGLKIFMWGYLKEYAHTKKDIIDASIQELLEEMDYWKYKLQL